MTNEEIIEKLNKMESIFKAASTVSTGVMNEEQARTFIREVKDESKLLSLVNFQEMTREKKKLYSINLAKRKMRKATKGVAPAVVDVDKLERTLDTVETIMTIDVYFEDIEDSIEEDNYEQTVNDIIVQAFANDQADLAINGDEASGDPFLSINNGFLEIADTDAGIHAVDIGGNDTNIAVFNAMLKAMPNKWKTDPLGLTYIVSPGRREDYIDELGVRKTVLGDESIVKHTDPNYKGIRVVGMNHMPDDRVLLTEPMNLVFGWYKRDIRVGKFINERLRRIEYTITSRSDQEYAVSDMIVLATA